MKTALIIGLIVVVIFVGLFLVKLAWSWVVPDIFGGAVLAGLVVPSLTMWQAFKVTMLLAALGLTSSASSKK